MAGVFPGASEIIFHPSFLSHCSKQYSMVVNDMDSWSHPDWVYIWLFHLLFKSGMLLKSWCLSFLDELKEHHCSLLVMSGNDYMSLHI